MGNPDKFWNAIDISVVIFSAPFIDITNNVMAVRLLRLFRVGKMTNAAYFPQVKMIFEGLTDALKAASFILLLLVRTFAAVWVRRVGLIRAANYFLFGNPPREEG